jgi:FkbM family methyltransferase
MSTPEHDPYCREPRAPVALVCIRWLTSLIPPIPHASGLSNRIVKPLWCRVTRQPVVLPVWGKTRMLLHPADTVGGNLTFIPHLWDRWERRFIRKVLYPGSVFVDVGSNIGAYALWAADVVGPNGRVVAIEADPLTIEDLRRNVYLNRLESVISVCHVGVSDRDEVLRVERRCGDPGVTRLASDRQCNGSEIACRTLAGVLRSAGIDHVDMLKIDIEGFEPRVLRQYFHETQHQPRLRPTHLLVEIEQGPLSRIEKHSLAELIQANQYELLHTGPNTAFRRK